MFDSKDGMTYSQGSAFAASLARFRFVQRRR